MKRLLAASISALVISQLTGCGKSQATMCSEIADKSFELSTSMIGKADAKTEKEMKEMSVDICMKMPEDTVKAQHKMLVK